MKRNLLTATGVAATLSLALFAGAPAFAQADAGTFTTKPFEHDYWEEVYLVSGDLTVGNDDQGNGGESFPPNTYACRPPHAPHGPFKSEKGCMLLEIHYFDPV